MKQIRNVGRWRLIGVAAMAALALVGTSQANVTFSSATSTVHINPTNSKVRIGKASNVTGWGQRSIIRAFGNNASTAWAEAYANGSVVGKNGVSGVTKPARTNFVDANSNAIASLGSNATLALIPATSNNLVLTARTYSSSILVLRSRADSTTILLRAMSNTVLTLSSLLRTTSNLINVINNNLTVPTSDSIDGTQFMRYHTGHHVFHNNGNAWTIRGWVRFNDGFTIMPLGSVIMDTLTTVSGAIDLRDTGTLILNNDLYLAHNVTLTNGGNIKGQASSSGQANTIFMGGDLTLASTTYARTLHITGDWSNSGTSGNLIIDGCGHTLNIGDRAQIFVDTNVTLTLRNMTIKTGPLSLNNSPIQLASLGSKLALDNVMFDLGADFHFITGQLFVHNEVAITGTSAFVYQSPVPSYITSGATLSFEQATTFSVAPSTYTDLPYTAGTATSNNFMVLADASAALSLNGCSFQTTFTGLRLRSGMVLFDNKVAIDTTAGVDLASLVTTGTTPVGFEGKVGDGIQSFGLAWSPDGRFLVALGETPPGSVSVYKFNGRGAPRLLGTVATLYSPRSVSWSPDGRFIAVTSGTISSMVQVYSFNGSSAPTLLGTMAGTYTPVSVSWSPDGRFIALMNNSSTSIGLEIYRFNGPGAPTLLVVQALPGSSPQAVSWSPDGRFLAVSIYNAPSSIVQVYAFNGTSGLATLVTTSLSGTGIARGLVWSPDGRFLSVIGQGPDSMQIFSFNGSSTLSPLVSTTAVNGPYSVAWSPDGRFLAVIDTVSNAVQVFRFNGSSLPIFLGTVATLAYPNQVVWSPDGRFLAVTTNSIAVVVYHCNYFYTGQPSATQGFSNGLLFGDKTQGSAFDANVQILSGAVVKVKGKIKDDSV